MPVNSAGDNVSGNALTDVQHVSGTMSVSGSLIVSPGIGNLAVDVHKVGINTAIPYTALSVVNDYATVTFELQMADSQGGGEIIKFGSGTLTAGDLYYLHTNATWTPASAAAGSTAGKSQLLGVALGTSPTTHGVLLRGFVRIPSTAWEGTANEGLPVYVSDDNAGHFDITAPAGNTEFVRIVGYVVDFHTDGDGDVLIYFNPDSTWVVVSA